MLPGAAAGLLIWYELILVNFTIYLMQKRVMLRMLQALNEDDPDIEKFEKEALSLQAQA